MLKISTGQLAEAGWELSIDIHDAKLNGNVISLAESTCIRMIEDIAGVDRAATMAELKEINVQVKALRQEKKSREQVKRLKELYRRREEIQFMPEYLCLVCDTKAQFRRACKGFSVNGMEYVRLVGTTGGVKNSTVVFVSTKARNGAVLAEELRRRIDNGRDLTKEFVPAKLEAYRALVCSASSPLSAPRGVLVVDDCVTHFKSSYILLQDSETDEPDMSVVEDGDVELIDSDGYGLMSPSLAQHWGYDLRLDYRPAGICIRNSFCKGMIFAFDFYEFAESVAGSYEVKDIWGQTHDIRNVDLILTASMLKLWDSYPSWDVYWRNCVENGYCFSATKVTPKELDVERRLNYQFIQSYHLTDEQIWQLVEPTVTELKDVMGDDYAKVLLYLRGTHITEEIAWSVELAWVAALMVDKRMLDDPYIRGQLKKLVRRRITEAKYGKIKVRGNYSVLSGDPFALCQSIWGMPVKGILKAGECYNKYWSDDGANHVAAFRAPMSSHHNIRKLSVNQGWSASHWYQYLDTVTVLNAWDMTCHALNGADKDGDLVFLTDNPILVDNIRDVLPIQCLQSKAQKCVPGEKEFINANVLGFGDEIGTVTNRITSQTELQSLFQPGTHEYEELQYRITAGQHVQQNCIDKMKGIVSKPMPKRWYDEKYAALSDDPSDVLMCASRKPYFMIYRYPDLHSRYKTFEKNVRRKCAILFGMSLQDLMCVENPTDEQSEFLRWIERLSPVQHGRGVMNRICQMCETYFADTDMFKPKEAFDPSIMKAGCSYSKLAKQNIASLLESYMDCCQGLRQSATSDQDYGAKKQILQVEYQEKCSVACPNEDELCDIVIDLCYSKERSKQFAWDMCGEVMLRHLLDKNDGMINYCQRSQRGDIWYGGRTYTMKQLCVKDGDHDGHYLERAETRGNFNRVWRNFE